MEYRLAADVGGTFTDIVLADEHGRLTVRKTLSTTGRFGDAVIDGAKALLRQSRCNPGEVASVLHATTAATNAILERSGGPTGLITTKGFRDVLEFRRLRTPALYDVFWTKPAPLIPRRLRREVAERIDAQGQVLIPLDIEEVRNVLHELRAAGIQSLAVAFLHSYRNRAHEQEVADLAKRDFPELRVTISSDVLQEIGEYERTSTTVANAYVMPVMTTYLTALREGLHDIGVFGPLMVMQSSGGMMTSRLAARLPVASLESGPAAGVVAAQQVLEKVGVADAVTFDMGGTTAKAAFINAGVAAQTAEYEIGAPVSASSRLLRGGGYLLRLRATDIAEVGAGGGSLVSLDAGGSLEVGPKSAGSSPGPVCYGNGGEHATVTDANVILGYLNPHHLLGGSLQIDRELASRVFEQRLSKPLGWSLEQAAYAVHVVCNAMMARAIRSVTTERGVDVRNLGLVAFGGNGPVHAAQLAESLGVRTVVIPPAPGLFSAIGLLAAPLEQRAAKTLLRRTAEVSGTELEELFAELEREVAAVLHAEGIPMESVVVRRHAEMRFVDQVHDLDVALPPGQADPQALSDAFRKTHEETYGYSADDQTELVTLRVVAHRRLTPSQADLSSVPRSSGRIEPVRQAFFGPAGWQMSEIVSREALTAPVKGPLIIEEYDTTVVVPPGCEAVVDEFRNVRLSWGS